jgi:hypothetical protein
VRRANKTLGEDTGWTDKKTGKTNNPGWPLQVDEQTSHNDHSGKKALLV